MRRSRWCQWYLWQVFIVTLVMMVQYSMWQAIDETVAYLLPDNPGARIVAKWLNVLVQGTVLILIVVTKQESILRLYAEKQDAFMRDNEYEARRAHFSGALAQGSSAHRAPEAAHVVSRDVIYVTVPTATGDAAGVPYAPDDQDFMNTASGTIPDITQMFNSLNNNNGLGPTTALDRRFA